MNYDCTNCKEEVYLDEDEEVVFSANGFLDDSVLSRCPYCIDEAISARIPVARMRMTGRGGSWARSGYHWNEGLEERTVEKREKE